LRGDNAVIDYDHDSWKIGLRKNSYGKLKRGIEARDAQ